MLWPNSWRENVTILANLINNNNEKGWNISLVFKGSQLLKRFFIRCSLIFLTQMHEELMFLYLGWEWFSKIFIGTSKRQFLFLIMKEKKPCQLCCWVLSFTIEFHFTCLYFSLHMLLSYNLVLFSLSPASFTLAVAARCLCLCCSHLQQSFILNFSKIF